MESNVTPNTSENLEKENHQSKLLSVPLQSIDYEKQKSCKMPKNQKELKPIIKKNNNITDSEFEFADPQIENIYGEIPSPRFGHSLIMLDSSMACLFGGAIEKNKNVFYLDDTYIFNILTKIWIKLNFTESNPPKRAAHGAAANYDYQMIIYGGSTNDGWLTDDKLWYLNFKNFEKLSWNICETVGKTPGPRYGHSLNFINPYFVLFGGCNPNVLNDLWIINIDINPSEWVKINFENDVLIPCARLYHRCAICEKGEYLGGMIIHGGRDNENKALNDVWVLKKNRKGNWAWNILNKKNEENNNNELKPRFDHSVTFFDVLLIIIGGRNGTTNNNLPIEVFNIETGQIYQFFDFKISRHTSFLYDNNIYCFGGINNHKKLYKNNDNELLYYVPLDKLFQNNLLLYQLIPKESKISKNPNFNKKKEATPQYKLNYHVVVTSSNNCNNNLNSTSDENNQQDDNNNNYFRLMSINKLQDETKRLGNYFDVSNNKIIQSNVHEKESYNKLLIDKILNDLFKPFDWMEKFKKDYKNLPLPVSSEEIVQLLKEITPILEKESSLIKIRPPCKIFGNIYGNYKDLMRFFESYGNPSNEKNGDINVMQYIFLGDFCDRGYHSLEVILLLFALKIKYPNFIYLVRGHHEDRYININKGLGDECKERLNDDIRNSLSVFSNINKVFDYLPFGILLDNNVLMVHGGIGSSINSLSDIEKIKRPVSVEREPSNKEQLNIVDLLWSEYSDDVEKIGTNFERDKYKKGYIVKYGKKQLNKFLEKNGIDLLITAHQFIQEGFIDFNNEKILSLFSSSNYMDKCKNVGAMIMIGKKTANKRINILPKLINSCDEEIESYKKNYSPSPIKDRK